jgi:hypothetical protein
VNLTYEMAAPRSFRRTLRAAHLKLIYSKDKTPAENLRMFEAVMRRVSAAVPLPEIVVEQIEESVVVEVDKTSVLSLPRRDRDPALVQQEINGCKSLLLEIIRRAAYDWVLYRTSTRIVYKKLAEQAFHWLFNEKPGHPDWVERDESGKQISGFMAICSALDLDPEAVRVHVRRLTPKNVMSVGRPPEYRRREPSPQSVEESPLSIDGSGLEAEWSVPSDDRE